MVVVTAVLANKCPYCYSYTDLVTAKQSENQIAHQKIKNTFGVNNMVAVIVADGGIMIPNASCSKDWIPARKCVTGPDQH